MRIFLDKKGRTVYEIFTKYITCTDCVGFQERTCPYGDQQLMEHCHSKTRKGHYSYKLPTKLIEQSKKKRW